MASSPPPSKSDETRVDLGDDLLEATRALEFSNPPAATEKSRTRSDVAPEKASEDELQSAQILMGEGLWGQAKDALHRSLRHNPSNAISRKLLEQIQQRELEALLAQSGLPETSRVVDEDIAEVIKKLDEDWNLGIVDFDLKSASLLASGEVQRELARSVSEQSKAMSLRDRADLAVGFLQMEMPEISAALLEPGAALSGGFLAVYCWALLQSGRPFECASHLEIKLRDEGLREEARRELEYLLARSRECLGEAELAGELFRILGDYRDSETRFHRIRSTLGGRE